MKEFVVIRLANKQDGSFVIPMAAYEDETSAVKEFYRLCGQAVDSTNITDTIVLMSKMGTLLDSISFEHEVDPPKSETIEEETEEEGTTAK